MERGLKVDSADGGMLDREVDDLADLVFIDAALDGRHDRDIEADLSQAVQRAQLLFEDVRLASNDAVGLTIEAVELEVDRGANLIQLIEETVVLRDTLAVRVDHHERDAACFRRLHEIDDQRMNRRFAAGELHDLGAAFGAHVFIEDLLHLFHGQVESWTSVGEAQRAVHVAGAVHFDDAETGVLLMVRTQATIMRASIVDLAVEG